jgi:hypothetical protein
MTTPEQRRAMLGLLKAARPGEAHGVSNDMLEELRAALSGEDAAFACCVLTRREIAEELNSVLDREEFAADDPRLTDEACQRAAAIEGEFGSDDRCFELRDQDRYDSLCELLREEFGLVPDDVDLEGEAEGRGGA